MSQIPLNSQLFTLVVESKMQQQIRKKKKDVCLWRTLSKVRTVSNSLLAVEKTKTNHAEPELFNAVDWDYLKNRLNIKCSQGFYYTDITAW